MFGCASNRVNVKCEEKIYETENEIVSIEIPVISGLKNKEFEEQVAKCETTEEKVNLLAEMVKYFKGLVDECFGAGTSEIVFGDANTLTMFYDFFEGITPYYEKASQQRMAKYGKKKK